MRFGFVLPALEDPMSGDKPEWNEIRGLASRAEMLGFDTVWVPDELYWKHPDWPAPRGFWECTALTAAVAGATEKIDVGTWVMSALHRNPALTAKVAETIDEVSDGRFVFGLGAGHAGSQGEAYGFPPDRTVGRYEEALEIIVPLMRGETVTYGGEFHNAVELENKPRGPRPGEVPLMLAGHGPRTVGLAVRYADIWSAYATDSSQAAAFGDRMALVERLCQEAGRDPETLGRSVGIFLEHPDSPIRCEDVGLGVPLRGSPSQVAEELGAIERSGATMIEISPFPSASVGIEFAGEVIAEFRT